MEQNRRQFLSAETAVIAQRAIAKGRLLIAQPAGRRHRQRPSGSSLFPV
jgi:hypothetical protein